MESIRGDDILILWHPKPPTDVEKYRKALRGGLGGPLFVALDRRGELWTVTQAHATGADDRREDVRRVLQALGLPVA